MGNVAALNGGGIQNEGDMEIVRAISRAQPGQGRRRCGEH